MNFKFGRHAGKSVAEVGSTYEGYLYLQWFMDSDKKKRESGEEQKYNNDDLTAAITAFFDAHPTPPVLSWEDKMAWTFRFGKYKGKTIEEVMRTWQGRTYLEYISTWDRLAERAMIKSVVDQFGRMPNAELDLVEAAERTMPYGLHKGELLREMALDTEGPRSPRSYLQYMLKKLSTNSKLQDQVLAREIEWCLNSFVPIQ
jgi:uncharacterized protein (DUF3820 family)